jgi:hypothetical protein
MMSASAAMPAWTDMRRWAGGLGVLAPDPRRAALAIVVGMIGTAAFIAVLDLWLFRGHLPKGYAAYYTSPLWPRLPAICAECVLEDLKYRLLLMTTLVALIAALMRRMPPAFLILVIAVGVQFVNVAPLVGAYPVYGSLRYWAVGTTWGWLYWRHGLLAAMAAHAGTHLILDPILLIGLH